jgi:protein O-GlcNAc transferase
MLSRRELLSLVATPAWASPQGHTTLIGRNDSTRTAALLLIGILPLSPLSFSQAGGTSSMPRTPSLEHASALLRSGEFKAARAELLSITKSAPGRPEGFLLLGTAEAQLHNLKAAEAAFRQAVALNPKMSDSRYNLGVVLLQERRPREAVKEFEEAQRIGPSRPELSVNLVRAHLEAGDRDRAVRTAESARRMFSDQPSFDLALGKSFLEQGVFSQALESLKKADALAPGQPDILFPLADACIRLRQLPAARSALQGIPAEYRTAAEFHYLEGRAAFLANDKAGAIGGLQAALQQDPRNIEYLLTLARYSQKFGDQKTAAVLFSRAEQIAPQLPEVYYGLAVSYFIADDFDAAANYSGQALKLDPKFGRAVFLLAISRFARGNLPVAEQLIGQAIAISPSNAFFHCFLGMVKLSGDKLDEAASDFREAERLDPTYALPRYQLGRVLVRTQRFPEARVELERAISLDPDLPEAYYQLSRVYEHLGEREKANQMLTAFKKFRAEEQSERTRILNEVHQAVQNNP